MRGSGLSVRGAGSRVRCTGKGFRLLAILSDPLLMLFVIMAKELRVEYRTYGREMAESFGFSGSIAIH